MSGIDLTMSSYEVPVHRCIDIAAAEIVAHTASLLKLSACSS
jgi:hypothetical protein